MRHLPNEWYWSKQLGVLEFTQLFFFKHTYTEQALNQRVENVQL